MSQPSSPLAPHLAGALCLVGALLLAISFSQRWLPPGPLPRLIGNEAARHYLLEDPDLLGLLGEAEALPDKRIPPEAWELQQILLETEQPLHPVNQTLPALYRGLQAVARDGTPASGLQLAGAVGETVAAVREIAATVPDFEQSKLAGRLVTIHRSITLLWMLWPLLALGTVLQLLWIVALLGRTTLPGEVAALTTATFGLGCSLPALFLTSLSAGPWLSTAGSLLIAVGGLYSARWRKAPWLAAAIAMALVLGCCLLALVI